VAGNLPFSVQARTLVGARLPSSRTSPNDSAQCGGGWHHPSPSVQAWTFAGARLPPMRASLGMYLQGVAAVGNLPFSIQARTLTGVCLPSSRASPRTAPRDVAAAGISHLPLSSRRRLPVYASQHRERVRERLRAVWRRPAPLRHCAATPRQKARVKTPLSSYLADDDFVLATFTSLEASSNSSYVLW
jgi:hypothetical protein